MLVRQCNYHIINLRMYTPQKGWNFRSLIGRTANLRSKSTLTRTDEARRAPGVTLTLLTRALSIAANGGSRFQARRATGTMLNPCAYLQLA